MESDFQVGEYNVTRISRIMRIDADFLSGNDRPGRLRRAGRFVLGIYYWISRQITIEVAGDYDARKYALLHVRNCVEDLHKRWFRNIKADEMVPCCCSECVLSENPQLYKLENLLKRRLKRSDLSCDISGEDLLIQTLLEGVYETTEIMAFNQTMLYGKTL